MGKHAKVVKRLITTQVIFKTINDTTCNVMKTGPTQRYSPSPHRYIHYACMAKFKGLPCKTCNIAEPNVFDIYENINSVIDIYRKVQNVS